MPDNSPMTQPVRHVSTQLVVLVEDLPTRLMVQIAASDFAPASVQETLHATSNGRPVELTEVVIPGNGRVHTCRPPGGELHIDYQATITGAATPAQVTEADRIVYRRPSRYAESDRLAPIAQAEFAGITNPNELLAAISSWTGSRLEYVPGSSQPTEGAVDTMLKRRGVCRDYAHLVVALLRGLDLPARLAAVYAPGLWPMDFHAVAEAAIDNDWRVVDSTLLAPRSSLVRIATGRDAADTPFLSTYGGAAQLVEARVTAIIDGPLPADDVTQLVSIT
jgi:transglutaminase-like putative cysteine protease